MDCVASTAYFQFAKAPPAGALAAPSVDAAPAAEEVALALLELFGYELGLLVYRSAVN